MSSTMKPGICKTSEGNIKYYRAGSGETLLLIHGITTYSFIWRKLYLSLSQKFDVISVDLMGCGDSEKPSNIEYSIKHHAEIIKEFLDNLGIEKVHLVAHDVGGGIGQIVAVNYPHILFDLILINSVGYDFWPVQPIISMRTPVIRQFAMATLDLGTFKLIIRRGLYYKENLSSELMDYFWKPMKTKEGRKAFLHFAKCLNNQDLLDIQIQLTLLSLPTLIIRGNADAFLSAEISEKLHEDIPKSKLVKIDDAGHFIQEDKPEILSEQIISFIEDNGKICS